VVKHGKLVNARLGCGKVREGEHVYGQAAKRMVTSIGKQGGQSMVKSVQWAEGTSGHPRNHCSRSKPQHTGRRHRMEGVNRAWCRCARRQRRQQKGFSVVAVAAVQVWGSRSRLNRRNLPLEMSVTRRVAAGYKKGMAQGGVRPTPAVRECPARRGARCACAARAAVLACRPPNIRPPPPRPLQKKRK